MCLETLSLSFLMAIKIIPPTYPPPPHFPRMTATCILTFLIPTTGGRGCLSLLSSFSCSLFGWRFFGCDEKKFPS